MSESKFLSNSSANRYYAEKSPHKDFILNERPIITVEKVFPGKCFVMFTGWGGDCLRIHAMLRANVIAMDKEGLFIMFVEPVTNNSIRVGYVPRLIDGLETDIGVFLAIPSRCTVERTLRVPSYGKDVRESLAAIMLVRTGKTSARLLGYDQFKKETRRTISILEDRNA